MTTEIGLLLALIIGSMILFATELLAEDVIALGVMAALILLGLLSPEEAFSGFGSDTFILLFGLFIMTAALMRTGLVELAGRFILDRAGKRMHRLMIFIMVGVAILSAFLSNTAATAFFLPLVLGLARRTRTSASKLLMPLAFAAILTSSVTLISTSSNVVVSGIMQSHGLAPMGMFELAPVGVPIAVAGLLYMYFIGRRLIPDRTGTQTTLDQLGQGRYTTEVLVMSDSPLVGKTLASSGLEKTHELRVSRLLRDNVYMEADDDTTLEAGDDLIVEGTRDALLKIKDITGLELRADVKFSGLDTPGDSAKNAEAKTASASAATNGTSTAAGAAAAAPAAVLELAEVLVVPDSRLQGRTLSGYGFVDRFGVHVLAISRHGNTFRQKLSDLRLRMGDILLIQGTTEQITKLDNDDAVQVLGAVQPERINWKRAPTAVATFAAAILLATFGVLPFSVAVLIGAIVVMLTRCITPEEAYREVQWKSLILIGSMLAIGRAMDVTGTAQYLADVIVGVVGELDPFWLMSAFFGLTVLLTQPMSNQAAAVVVIPIAIATAVTLGLNPRAFAMTVALAASVSYLTPLEPSCLMVYGPGRYRFTDFLRVGGLLTLIIYGITMALVPLVWPLSSPS